MLRYYHVELFFGCGLESDFSDYIMVGICDELTSNNEELESLILANYLLKNTNKYFHNYLLLEKKTSQAWKVEEVQEKDWNTSSILSPAPTPPAIIFYMAMYINEIITVGQIKEIPQEAYEALNGMFHLTFLLTSG